MGSIATYADFRDLERNAPLDRLYPCWDSPNKSTAGATWSYWISQGHGVNYTLTQGVAPSTAAVPTRTTPGAWGQRNPSAGKESFIGTVRIAIATANGTLQWICDRLSHQGGLSGLVGAGVEQTFNLPTAPLTRYTSGEGVMAALEVYTQIGATAVTATVEYTNQDGTAGRVSPAFTIGGTAYREVGRLIVVPMMAGDRGVRSVEGVTLSGVSGTGTAGNFGVTLFKPLLSLALPATDQNALLVSDPIRDRGGDMPKVETDACLWWVDAAGGSQGGDIWAQVDFVEA